MPSLVLPLDTGTIVGELSSGEHPQATRSSFERSTGQQLQVFPAVRALARKLDVDLDNIEGTGPDGTITRADVERAATRTSQAGRAEPCAA